MRTKIVKSALAAVLGCALASPALADRIEDNYWGGGQYYDYGFPGTSTTADVYGGTQNPSEYEVYWMDVDVVGNDLQVTVSVEAYNLYDNLGSCTSNCGNYYPDHSINWGDLFISTNGWTPNDAGGTNMYRNEIGGTQWDYAFDTSGNQLAELSDYTSINNNAEIILAYESVGASSAARDWQEVEVDTSVIATANLVDYSNTAGLGFSHAMDDKKDHLLTYRMALSDLGLSAQNDFSLGFHWAITCANDVIEGAFSHTGTGQVPAPAVVSLLAFGLLAPYFRRRVKQAA